MFNFKEEAEKELNKIHDYKCQLCKDTGQYFIHNRKKWCTCYGCDANEKKINEQEGKEKKS